ncbi:MAG: hypothetical protein C6Y22_30550 [Hapalosiphonaceae cyanobacterium JJU2]|nr:MAG: hypothetical protein C6Y22_30550 [Hapalosiphonaceae cyanobacterium JJU2]
MAELSFVSSDDVRRYLNSLPLQQKEALLAEELRSLSAESRAKVLGLSNSGLTLLTGSVTCFNSDFAIIQNTSAFDPETVFKSLADFWQSETNKNSSI